MEKKEREHIATWYTVIVSNWMPSGHRENLAFQIFSLIGEVSNSNPVFLEKLPNV
jgi:hypothetical protein